MARVHRSFADIQEYKKTMKTKMIVNILQLFINIISVWLILTWYDWKLLVIFILFTWANNMMMGEK